MSIVETYLPYEYFALVVGVQIDQKVFMSMIKEKFDTLYNKFLELEMDPQVLAF